MRVVTADNKEIAASYPDRSAVQPLAPLQSVLRYCLICHLLDL